MCISHSTATSRPAQPCQLPRSLGFVLSGAWLSTTTNWKVYRNALQKFFTDLRQQQMHNTYYICTYHIYIYIYIYIYYIYIYIYIYILSMYTVYCIWYVCMYVHIYNTTYIYIFIIYMYIYKCMLNIYIHINIYIYIYIYLYIYIICIYIVRQIMQTKLLPQKMTAPSKC